MVRRVFVPPVALLLLAACATDRRFIPRENQNGWGPGGEPAAIYTLAPPAQAEVRLWSDGAERVEVGGRETTRLHVGFEIENNGGAPLRFDTGALRVAGIATGKGRLADLPAVEVRGAETVAPGTTARIDARFDPGAEVMPRAIDGFEVRWRIVLGDQQYVQATPFLPWYPPTPSVYWYGGWCW